MIISNHLSLCFVIFVTGNKGDINFNYSFAEHALQKASRSSIFLLIKIILHYLLRSILLIVLIKINNLSNVILKHKYILNYLLPLNHFTYHIFYLHIL